MPIAFLLTGLRCVDGQGHEERTGSRTIVLIPPHSHIQVLVHVRPDFGVGQAVEHVVQEKAAEEHDFGDEERPHSYDVALVLLTFRSSYCCPRVWCISPVWAATAIRRPPMPEAILQAF